MSKNLEILVADDDRAILTVIEEALSRKGHTVRATDSGSRLWTWVEEASIKRSRTLIPACPRRRGEPE